MWEKTVVQYYAISSVTTSFAFFQVPHQGMKSRIQVPLEKTGIQHPESRIHGMGSRIQELSCIRLHGATVLVCERRITIFPLFTFHWSGAHIWRPLLMKFQLEGFFLLLIVSSYQEWLAFVFTLQETVRSPRLLLYRSQLIKKLAHANNKVSTLISNRATSVKVTRK